MVIKRKRSVDDSPLSVSSFGGAVRTPDAQSPSLFPQDGYGAMQLDMGGASRAHAWDFISASRVKSSDWGNRTRKRVRDGRPDEKVIHENTVNMLFAAQRALPADPAPAPESEPIALSLQPQPIQKSTLHSFWNISAPPVQPPIFSTPHQHGQDAAHLPHCEDCDTPLHSEDDGMDIDVDMELYGAVETNPFACSECGKSVCGTCAVAGVRRSCLGCATRATGTRRWW